MFACLVTWLDRHHVQRVRALAACSLFVTWEMAQMTCRPASIWGWQSFFTFSFQQIWKQFTYDKQYICGQS